MAYTTAQRDALQAAIASGALEVEYGDKRVKYRSLGEMQQLLSQMDAALGTKKPSRRLRTSFSKGIQ
jgi:hypothetical protein